MMLSKEDIAKQIVDIAKQAERLGLNRGTSGNMSVRFQEGFLVTPSGLTPDEMFPDKMVEMNFAGEAYGKNKPSSEWRFHCDILAARPEVGAVVHTHSIFATVLACLGKDVPPFHYMIAVVGGDSIRCAPYALFGSRELSNYVVNALEKRKACLLQNHGMVALGKDLKEAFSIAIEVETICEQYCRTLQLGGPRILSDKQMQEVLEKFKNYGKWIESSKTSSTNVN